MTTLEGMARAAWENLPADERLCSWADISQSLKNDMMDKQKAALLWLADHVTEDMRNAFIKIAFGHVSDRYSDGVSAAIRAAAESEG